MKRWFLVAQVSRFEFERIDLALAITSLLANQPVASESERTRDQCQSANNKTSCNETIKGPAPFDQSTFPYGYNIMSAYIQLYVINVCHVCEQNACVYMYNKRHMRRFVSLKYIS